MTERFRINIPDAELDRLDEKLRAWRRPSGVLDEGGIALDAVEQLVDAWQRFDWRAQEAALNAFPQFIETVDGVPLHFIHVPSSNRSAIPLLLLHGWPGSFVEMRYVIAPLAERFHVLAPSLPGYGFSPLPTAGFTNRRIAGVMAELMTALGYERFGVQGGDWGAGIGTWLALTAPDRVIGLHLNYIPGSYAPFASGEMSDEEREFLRSKDEWVAESGAYGHVQRTRPLTLSYGLSDSPAGLGAWIYEMFLEWSDPATRPSLDDILTNISVYWFTNTIGSSVRLYRESVKTPLHFTRPRAVAVPTGILRCPREAPFPPRSWIERGYDVTQWIDADRGGHFAALEVPETFVDAVTRFFTR